MSRIRRQETRRVPGEVPRVAIRAAHPDREGVLDRDAARRGEFEQDGVGAEEHRVADRVEPAFGFAGKERARPVVLKPHAPWNAAYVQPSRRPTDGRYGDNPNRLQHYYQYQVVMKPSPLDIQELYLGSLRMLGIDPKVHDIRFVEDNWESPTLGAWGLGWEVWLNGMEVTQFTYFQQVGGLDCRPVTGEITYGLERIAMYLQGVESVFDLVWTDAPQGKVLYGDVFHQNEVEMSAYNFEHANTAELFHWFDVCEKDSQALIDQNLPLPAYELRPEHLAEFRQAVEGQEGLTPLHLGHGRGIPLPEIGKSTK